MGALWPSATEPATEPETEPETRAEQMGRPALLPEPEASVQAPSSGPVQRGARQTHQEQSLHWSPSRPQKQISI
uniref:Uncharacterized protein n=1 Tax=Knipowitschia caucasica TaxID=637954 RepID=A0AAV2KRA2_KNICA